MNRKGVLGLILAVAIGLFGVGEASAQTKFKYATLGKADPFAEPAYGGSMSFKFILEKYSGGRLQMDLYPSGTLGKEVDLLEAAKNNVIQFFSASMVVLHRVFPPAMTLMSPYLFRNEAVAREVIDGPYGQKLLDAFTAKTGVKGVSIRDLGFSAITNSLRPLRKPEDFKGIKFRGMDTLQVTMFESLGGSAVPIAWPEVYTSLQTGVVHGQTNPPSIIAGFKINEVQKYMTLANSQYMYQFLVANQKTYDGLSEADKRLLLQAAAQDRITCRGLSVVVDVNSVEEVKKKGMQVTGLNDEELSAIQKIVRPACLKWLRTQMETAWIDELEAAVAAAEKKLGYAN
jgi:tripartite ATP-independent transporter DctP family solute receptor